MSRETLERIAFIVPDDALEMFESALGAHCRAVSFYQNEAEQTWLLEAVREHGANEAGLQGALALAEMITGFTPDIERGPIEAGGWLAKTRQAFPEQVIGKSFAVRGTHVTTPRNPHRFTMVIDAGLAFGSGEHFSTRLCLIALEDIARHHRPRRIADIGAGSGVLGFAAAHSFHRPILATDIDARAVRVARENAKLNRLHPHFRAVAANGWNSLTLARAAPFDLVFANILARPLCAMAKSLARNLAPGGIAILAGLLNSQANQVIAAHRRAGLILERKLTEDAWAALILRRPAAG
jgi:ribosomal protein L11 methyltransferase